LRFFADASVEASDLLRNGRQVPLQAFSKAKTLLAMNRTRAIPWSVIASDGRSPGAAFTSQG
jgi:hypothetical protein